MANEVKIDRDVARVIGRAIWAVDFDVTKPDASPEDRKVAWDAAKAEYVPIGAKVYRRLVNAGCSIEGPTKAE